MIKGSQKHAEDLRIKLALDKHELIKEMVEQSADTWCQEQMTRKLALKDELREKIISLFEKAQIERFLLKRENNALRKEKSKLEEERKHQREILQKHMNCAGKVVSSISSFLISF